MTTPLGPDSELLRTFLAVATHENTTRAARSINRTQSAVSIQIKKLEHHLDAELFERLPRGMRLTEAGRSLRPRAERVLAEIDAIGAHFGNPLAGKIRLGVPDDYSTVVLQRALYSFSRRHTDVEVQVTCGCSGGYPDLVKKNELDLAIYSAPPTDPSPVLFEEPMVWAAHRDLDLSAGAPIPLAVFERHCWWRDVPTDTLGEAGFDWYVAFSSESHDGVRAAVQSRMAVGILPESGLPTDVEPLRRLPLLPASRLVLLKASGGSRPLIDAMSESLASAFEPIASL